MYPNFDQFQHPPHPIIQKIKKDGEEALNKVYQQYRKGVVSMVKNELKLNEEKAVALFQEAVLLFYKLVLHDKLSHLENSPESYLFEIIKSLHQNEVQSALLHQLPVKAIAPWDPTPNEELIAQLITDLDPPCKALLGYFYHQQRSIDWIKEKLKLESEDEVIHKKFNCLKRLKETVINFRKGF